MLPDPHPFEQTIQVCSGVFFGLPLAVVVVWVLSPACGCSTCCCSTCPPVCSPFSASMSPTSCSVVLISNQSVNRSVALLQVAFSYIWPSFFKTFVPSWQSLSLFRFFIFVFLCIFLFLSFFVCVFLVLNLFWFFLYFLTFSFLSVLFLFFVNSFRLFDGWALFVFGCLFIYPACRFGNLFSLFSFFVVFGYHSITSVLQSTSAVSHWWSDWTHPDQPVWGCLNSVLAVLLHHLELIQLSKKTNLYMLNI